MEKFFYLFSIALTVTSISCSTPNLRAPNSLSPSWENYASDPGATKFSQLNIINQSNIKDLQQAWSWESPDNEIIKSQKFDTAYYQATPIFANGSLYTSTSLNQVVALNPENGKQLWVFNPETYKNGFPGNSGFAHRGVAYWEDNKYKRVIFATNDGYLIALDADSGKPVESFGTKNGRVDLTKELRTEAPRSKYGVTSPPVICSNTIIVGSSIADFYYKFGAPVGDVRGFDVKTGQLLWTFHTVPLPNEPGSKTWPTEYIEKNNGHTNVWAPMSYDSEIGAVFLPVSAPANDFYGGERHGDNLYGNSLVSLNCKTGKLNWAYQLVHHDLWDYDNPTAPILMDLEVNGKKIKAVAQVTKQAFTYVFNRENGQPVWPIVETAVPQSTVSGEKTAKTQPIPTKPPAFDRQGLSENDLIDFTPSLKQAAKEFIADYSYGPLYTPPTTEKKGTIHVPGVFGGASWSGAAFNPNTKELFVPSVSDTYQIVLGQLPFSDFKYVSKLGGSKFIKLDGDIPLLKPPYGRITSFNMNAGEKKWIIPVGVGPKEALLKAGVNKELIPKEDLGWNRRIHVMLTPDLLFATQSGRLDIVGVHMPSGLLPNSYKIQTTSEDPSLLVFDPKNGSLLAKYELPSNGWAAPMTYSYKNKQYVLVPRGGGGLSLDAGITVFALK